MHVLSAYSRPLQLSDTPTMARLIHGDGLNWQQTQDDLFTLISRDEETVMIGMFSGENGDDNEEDELLSIAGLSIFHSAVSSSSTRNDFGWLSYVATTPHARRKGYASSLISSLLTQTEQEVPIGLFASSLGEPLYEKYGFVSSGATTQLVQYEYIGSKNDAANDDSSIDGNYADKERLTSSAAAFVGDYDIDDIDPITIVPASEVISEVIALDTQVYGISREEILKRWMSETATEENKNSKTDTATDKTTITASKADFCFCLSKAANWALMNDDKKAQGFILGRPLYHPGHVSSGIFLGPIIAQNDKEASLLLETALLSLFRKGATLVQCLTLLDDNDEQNNKDDDNHGGDGALNWCKCKGLLGIDNIKVKYTKLGDRSKLMVRGQSLPWLDKMRRQKQEQDGMGKTLGSHKETEKLSSPHSFAASGYEYG